MATRYCRSLSVTIVKLLSRSTIAGMKKPPVMAGGIQKQKHSFLSAPFEVPQ